MTIKHKQSGFTLVELSIVLVIIGLIVGGVLAGRDMIAAAEIRSTISQVERYNTAVNTFRDKFGGIPGDINATKATQFGFTAKGADLNGGPAGQRDGNRLVEACESGEIGLGCETVTFWRDLSDAGMVDDRYDTATDAYPGAAVTVSDYLPTAKLGQGNFIHVYPSGGRNTLLMTGVSATLATGGLTLTPNLTPQTAFNIDDKLDDGNPTTGSINAQYDVGIAANDTALTAIPDAGGTVALTDPGDATAVFSDCASDPTTDGTFVYNTGVDTGFGETPGCQISIRTAF